MNFIKLIKYDIKNGFIECYKKIILIAVISLVSCISTYSFINHLSTNDSFEYSDYVLACFEGVAPLELTIGYDFNAIWLFIQIIIAYMIGVYTVKDLHGYGSQVLIRSGSRIKWWLSKVIWSTCMIILSYIVMHLVIFSWTVITGGNLGIRFNKDFIADNQMTRVARLNTTSGKAYLILCLMPILVSIVYSAFQILLSLYIAPVLSYIVVQILIFSATFFTKGYLLANYSMIAKYDIATTESFGIGFPDGVIKCICSFAIIIVIGAIGFNRYDIMSSNRKIV